MLVIILVYMPVRVHQCVTLSMFVCDHTRYMIRYIHMYINNLAVSELLF